MQAHVCVCLSYILTHLADALTVGMQVRIHLAICGKDKSDVYVLNVRDTRVQ